MNQLSPENCDLGPLAEAELPKRAEAVLQNADKIGCRKFVSAQDIHKVQFQFDSFLNLDPAKILFLYFCLLIIYLK
jgi:hypothetical protein